MKITSVLNFAVIMSRRRTRVSETKGVARSQKTVTKVCSLSEERKESRVLDIEEMPKPFEENTVNELRSALLEWWDEDDGKQNQRATPWRTMMKDDIEKYAYGVWVSEIMLQQTQTDRVIAYWENWMKQWPTYRDLASANLDQVRALWTGLGYYRRAEYLLLGAQGMVANGGLPRTHDEWLKVKGVGAYTAAAIASVCFGERVPLVDGNVIRVFSRLKKINLNLKSSSTQKLYWQLAGQLVDESNARPGDTNQALMELGATVCIKSSKPKCTFCPWRSHCSLQIENLDPLLYPPPNKIANTKLIHLAIGIVIRSDATFALVKQPKSNSLLAHDDMWHLPTAQDAQSLQRMALDLGLSWNHFFALDDTIDHTITSTRYKFKVYLIDNSEDLTSDKAQNINLAWVSEAQLMTKGSSSIVTKALAHLRKRASLLSPSVKKKTTLTKEKAALLKQDDVPSILACASLLIKNMLHHNE